MNTLNQAKGYEEVGHKSVSKLMRMGMSENEASECQNVITCCPYVPQELWPSTRDDRSEQNYHLTQIPTDIEIVDGFAMDYQIALFSNLDEMVTPKEVGYEKIKKRLDEMKIMLGEEINGPIAIMHTYGGKQWSSTPKSI